VSCTARTSTSWRSSSPAIRSRRVRAELTFQTQIRMRQPYPAARGPGTNAGRRPLDGVTEVRDREAVSDMHGRRVHVDPFTSANPYEVDPFAQQPTPAQPPAPFVAR